MDYSKLVQLGLLQGSDQQDAARMGLFNILSQIGAASAPRTSPTPPPIDLAKAMNVYQSSMKNALTQGALRRQLKKESGLKQLFEAQPMDPVEARKIAAAKVDPLAETYAATGILSPDDDPQSYYQDKRQALMPDALKVAEQQTTMPDLLKAVTPSQRPLIQGLMKVDPELGIKTLISLRGKISDIPSSVREYNYYQTLKPEDQATFLRIKRATKTIDLADRVVIQSPTGETSTILKKGLPPGQQPELKKRQAISQQEGTAIGKKKGQALNIPGEEAKANYDPFAKRKKDTLLQQSMKMLALDEAKDAKINVNNDNGTINIAAYLIVYSNAMLMSFLLFFESNFENAGNKARVIGINRALYTDSNFCAAA